MTEPSGGARFDYDNKEVIRLRKELAERQEALRKQGPPTQTLWYPGCGKHLLTVLVVASAVVYAWFANYPAPPLSPILYQWQAMGENTTKFQHKGYDIFYVDKVNENTTESDSPTLLYLHGFPTSSFDLHLVLANLTRNFDRIIAPDFIGYGFSAKPRFYSYSIMDQTELVVELVELLKLKRVHLLTHDYGDTVGQELLARYSEKKINFEIVSVCMMNGGVFPTLHQPVLMQKLFRTPVVGTIAAKFANYYLFALSFSGVFGPATKPGHDTLTDSWKLIRLNDGYRVWGSLLSYIDERFEHETRWVGALSHSPVPLHFIYGPDDPVNPYPVFEVTYNNLVNKPSITTLPGIGHYPQLEAPEQMVKAYFDFLLGKKLINQIN